MWTFDGEPPLTDDDDVFAFDEFLAEKSVKFIYGHPRHDSRWKLIDHITVLERDLLNNTLYNIGCPFGEFKAGLLACGSRLGDANETMMFKQIGFESVCKYVLLRKIKRLTEATIYFEQIVRRDGIPVDSDVEKRTRTRWTTPLKKLIQFTSTSMMRSMMRNALHEHGVLGECGTFPFHFKDAPWPGSVELQRMRLLCMLELPYTSRVQFVADQIGSDAFLIVPDIIDDMIDTVFASENPRKRKALEEKEHIEKKIREATVVRSHAPVPEDVPAEDTVIVPIPEPRERRNAQPNVQREGAFIGKRVVAQFKNSWEHRTDPLPPTSRKTWRGAIIFIIAVALLRVGMEANFTTDTSDADVPVWVIMTLMTAFCVFL